MSSPNYSHDTFFIFLSFIFPHEYIKYISPNFSHDTFFTKLLLGFIFPYLFSHDTLFTWYLFSNDIFYLLVWIHQIYFLKLFTWYLFYSPPQPKALRSTFLGELSLTYTYIDQHIVGSIHYISFPFFLLLWGCVKLIHAKNRCTIPSFFLFTNPSFIAQLTKIYLGGRMLGFLSICGQFGKNNELFVLTSYLTFSFYFFS